VAVIVLMVAATPLKVTVVAPGRNSPR
jgi:hypothetical protein